MVNNTNKKELYATWHYIKYVSIIKGKLYEGVPTDWNTWEEFYLANIDRYRKAKKKWSNYKLMTYDEGHKSKIRVVHLVRKVKSLGFTLSNTCFTSPSDKMKYHKPAHKYILSRNELGTRDIKNLLEKRGVTKSMNTLMKQKKSGVDIFKRNHRRQYMWKGKLRCLRQIQEMEGLSGTLFRQKILIDKMSIEDAIKHCNNYKSPFYIFEGETLPQGKIVSILHKRSGLGKLTIKSRFCRSNFPFYSDITSHIPELTKITNRIKTTNNK